MACFIDCGTSWMRDEGAALLAEFADQMAVGGIDPQRDLRLVVGQHFEGGKLGIGQDDHDRQQGEADEGKAARNRMG
jgi:hypothetical protein